MISIRCLAHEVSPTTWSCGGAYFVEPLVGFEPTTARLQGECSTTELKRLSHAGVLCASNRLQQRCHGREIVSVTHGVDCHSSLVSSPVVFDVPALRTASLSSCGSVQLTFDRSPLM